MRSMEAHVSPQIPLCCSMPDLSSMQEVISTAGSIPASENKSGSTSVSCHTFYTSSVRLHSDVQPVNTNFHTVLVMMEFILPQHIDCITFYIALKDKICARNFCWSEINKTDLCTPLHFIQYEINMFHLNISSECFSRLVYTTPSLY